jgi:type I restriction enzyme S subunit
VSKWEMVKLSDVGDIITGNTPRTSDEKNYSSNDLSFFKPSDMGESTINVLLDSENHVSDYARAKCRILPPQSVLVTCIGIIGKVGITTGESTCNQQINAIIPNNKVCLPKYLAYAIYREKQKMNDIANAAVVPIINKSQFSNLEIVFPPIAVQQKIADILDISSAALEKRRAQIDKLDLLIKSQFIEMFGDPVTNPKGWESKPLEKISKVGSSKRVFVEELVDEGIPFYRGTEIGAMATGTKIVSSLFITNDNYNLLKSATGVPNVGDLLMPSICPDGRIWQVDTDEPFYFKDGRVLWVSFEKDHFNKTYLLYALKNKIVADYMNIASGTTFAELKIFSLKKVQILLPPLELQNQFASFVQQVESQKSLLQTSLEKLELNHKSLMQKAFRGELF